MGIWFWTFFEYCLHRFLFHGEDYMPDVKIALMLHFLLHGIHHSFPQDPLRLVFPITMGYLILLTMLIPLLNFLFPVHILACMKIGTILGYIAYDEIHYFTHHASPKSGYFKYLKMYHMAHHYREVNLGFGVSQKFWDIVFRTELKI